MQTVVAIEPAQQSLRLGSHEAELNRIDTAILSEIFDALIDASIVSADVAHNYEGRPIPTTVQTCLSRLHCAITDLEASLKTYVVLSGNGR
jgi:hypothetical protein